jgi:bacteriorhodopsin
MFCNLYSVFRGVVGSPALGYVSADGLSLIIVYFDVIAKVPFTYIAWHRRFCFDSDVADGAVDSASDPTPAGGTPTDD